MPPDLRNTQIFADFPGKDVLYLTVTRDGGAFPSLGVYPPLVTPALPQEAAPLLAQVLREPPLLHAEGS